MKREMTNYYTRIEVPEGEVKRIIDELTRAQQVISNCYDRLIDLGVVTIVKAPEADTTDAEGK